MRQSCHSFIRFALDLEYDLVLMALHLPFLVSRFKKAGLSLSVYNFLICARNCGVPLILKKGYYRKKNRMVYHRGILILKFIRIIYSNNARTGRKNVEINLSFALLVNLIPNFIKNLCVKNQREKKMK